jgi:hypothetical protein
VATLGQNGRKMKKMLPTDEKGEEKDSYVRETL